MLIHLQIHQLPCFFPKKRNVSGSGSLHLLFPLSKILFPQVAVWFGLLLPSGLCSDITSMSLPLIISFNIEPLPHATPSPPCPPFLLHFTSWHLPSNIFTHLFCSQLVTPH